MTEGIFHGKDTLLGILRPHDPKENTSFIVKISLKKLNYKIVTTSEIGAKEDNHLSKLLFVLYI